MLFILLFVVPFIGATVIMAIIEAIEKYRQGGNGK